MENDRITDIKDLYSKWAPSYDESFHSVAVLVEEDLIKIINPQPSDNILDIGCGTGRLTEQLYKYCNNVTGIDISKEMLKLAKAKLPNIKFTESNIEEKLPFEDNCFDKITSSLTFQFLQNIQLPLGEIHRVLKPGGKAYITTFVSDAPLNWSDVEYKIKKEKTIPSGSVQKISTFRPLDEYSKVAENLGFNKISHIPLVTNEKTREFVTDESWNKIQGKWASVVLILEK